MFTRAKTSMLAAEFIGTAMLASIVLIMSNTTAVSYFIATSVALVLASIVMLFGGISGAFVNPAITFGMWTSRKISTVRAASYIVAELLGGLAAWQLFQYLTGHKLTAHSTSYSTKVLIAEAIGAAILSFGVAAVVSRRADAVTSAVTVGAVIFGAVMVAALASSAYINPAVALAARSWSTAYVVGPLIGGVVGVNLYTLLYEPRSSWSWNGVPVGRTKPTVTKKKTVRKK